MLYQDFDTITTSLLKTSEKSIDKIQNILQLKEAKNLNKRATRGVGNLAMALKDKRSTPGQKKRSMRMSIIITTSLGTLDKTASSLIKD